MDQTEYSWEIRPKNNLLDLKLKEVIAYRDLLGLLVKRDFVSFYKQTALGPVWFFIQPLVTTIMYTVIFRNLAGLQTGNVPAPLFYLAGITAWNYFAECLLKTSTVFRDNANIFGKVYFPRLIMPVSIVVSNLVKFAVQFLLLLAMMAFYAIKGVDLYTNGYILLFPLLVIILACLGLGFGMIVSALTTRYRDLVFLITFIVPLLMYATTVVYPLSQAQEKFPAYSWIIKYNPLTPVIEAFRYGFLGDSSGSFSWGMLLYSIGFTIVTLITGTVIFNKVEKNFVDTI